MVVVSDEKGLNELGMLSHEASIIATKERVEMKMIEFFIPRKLSLTALGIQSQSAVSRKALNIKVPSFRCFKTSVRDANEDISQRRLVHIGANDKRVVEEGTR